MEKEMKARIVHKHDIEANWNKAVNFIPMQGEIIVYDIDENYNYERIKIGDGQTVVANLPFTVSAAVDISDVGIYYIATEDPDYPLIADAEADNTLAMQNLIKKVHDNGGGIIWLPIGTYGFDKNSADRIVVSDDFRMCVKPMSNVSIIGESLTETVIRIYGVNSDTAWIGNQVDRQSTEVALSGFTYQNFTVDMSDAYLTEGEYSSTGKAFGMKAIKNCVFRDLRILNSPATGFGIDMLDNVVIDSVYVYNCGKQWEYGNPGGAGIGIGTGRWEQENFIVRNCVCAGCGHFGIFIEDQGIFDGNKRNWTMGKIIANNVVRNGKNYGIGIRGGQNVVVTGNNIYRNKGGIYLDYGAQRVMVSNNAVSENTENGLLFGTEDAGFGDYACENVAVFGNSFFENKFGIFTLREPVNSKIENNIYIGNDADTLTEMVIDASKIKQGVYINDAGEEAAHARSWLYDEYIDLNTTLITWTPIGETETGDLKNPRIAIYDENKVFLHRINGDYEPSELDIIIEEALTTAGKSTNYRYIKFGDNCEGEILNTLKLYNLTINIDNSDINQPLTFTGAVNATYDGSKAVNVEIPRGDSANKYPDWSHLKWYVMGDSLTAQNNAFTNKRYYDFVQEKTGIQLIVDGIGGTGYGAGVSNNESFQDRVQNIPEDVDVVTIFGSGNDILHLELDAIPVYSTLAWLAFNRPGLRVIVVPPSPWKDYNKREDPWKAYCDRLQVSALACDFRYVSDMYDCPPFNGRFTGHMEKFFTTDSAGIHPNEAGHEALAPYFYNALMQELALKV